MLGTHKPAPSPSEAHVLSKWRLIAWYWAAQAALIALAAPVWIQQGESVDGPGRPLGVWKWHMFADLLTRWEWWGSVALVILALMLLQTVLIWPVRRPRFRARRGLPVWLSIGAAILLGTCLSAALALGLATIVQVNEDLAPDWPQEQTLTVFIVWCVLSTAFGATLMLGFCSRRLRAGDKHESILARIAATLFTGTLIEAAAIMPIDIMFRRRQDCYCLAGTFWAYTLLIGAGLVTLGPAILLPILLRRRKRWYASRCDCCGYDMTGLLHAHREIERCPECGAGWRAEKPIP